MFYRIREICIVLLTLLLVSFCALSNEKTNRDDLGIPLIRGNDRLEVYEEFGYVMAQDRLWQFETNRRLSQGRLAEIFGPKMLPVDQQTLLMGYTRNESEQIFEDLDRNTKELVLAYVKGVNKRVHEVLENPAIVPLEFQLLGISPSTFDAMDIMTFSTALMRRFGMLGGGELENLAIMQKLVNRFGEADASSIFEDFVWMNDPDAPTYVDGNRAGEFVPGHVKAASNNTQESKVVEDAFILQRSADFNHQQAHEDMLLKEAGLDLHFGSLAWALSEEITGTGYPILVGQPQMGYQTPNMFAEVRLVTQNTDVAGLTLPLFPAISIGHNSHIAWSHMVGMGDSIDIYQEKLNPLNRLEYWFKGRWKKMTSRIVQIPVRGESQPRSMTIYRTLHGPVFSPIGFDPLKQSVEIVYSRKLVHWMREPFTLQGWMKINAATNSAEFARGAAEIMSSLHSIYADTKGNIGYWHTGMNAQRAKAYDPRFPLPGTGEAEWTGRYLPGIHEMNPTRGYIAGWNNKAHPSVRNPFPSSPNYQFGSYHRSQWVTGAIERSPELNLAANKAMIEYLAGAGTWMGNIHNGVGLTRHSLLPLLREAVKQSEKKSEKLWEVIEVLENWDGRSATNLVEDVHFQVGHVIYLEWLSRFTKAVFEDEFEGIHSFDTLDNRMLGLLLRSLEGSLLTLKVSRNYMDNIHTDRIETQNELLLASLRDTIDHLSLKFGQKEMADWKQERNVIEFNHPLFGKLAEMYDSNMGTYVQIIELKPEGAKGYSRWPLGQSAFVSAGKKNQPKLDPDYLRMMPLYKAFRYREK